MADRRLFFDKEFIQQLTFWAKTEPRRAVKVLELIEEIRRDPFRGTGKPEPLKHLGPNQWSRRITEEHRLTYRVFDDRVEFVTCRHHSGS